MSVALDGRPVLSQLTLRIPGGSRLGLIGPNGSGKTTLLRAIAGLVPHQGEIRVGDAAGTTLSRRELARRVALVPQIPAVPAGVTVTDYVLLGRTPTSPTSAASPGATSPSWPRCSTTSTWPRSPAGGSTP